MKKLKIYGTLGPACQKVEVLENMFRTGMSGVRLNLSHTTLSQSKEILGQVFQAAQRCKIQPEILIDMIGPEIRTGKRERALILEKGQSYFLSQLRFPDFVKPYCIPGQHVLVDDGKMEIEILDNGQIQVLREGILESRKTVFFPGVQIDCPALTEQDVENLRVAKDYGVTGIMQPFVRGPRDLAHVKKVLDSFGLSLKVLAKIENQDGIDHLESLFPYCDEIVIARGDLGSSIGLCQLPRIQRRIEAACHKHHKPYMVVTEMLDSMQRQPTPTRAEVNDIYDAVIRGASSIMLTGESAKGKYPEEAMRYFCAIAQMALEDRKI